LQAGHNDSYYSVFRRFRQAKSAYNGSILSSILLQLRSCLQQPQKMKLASRMVKIDSKIIIPRPRSKVVKLAEQFKAEKEIAKEIVYRNI
jgi:hypothetical protein